LASKPLVLTREGPAALLRLNQPRASNAITPALAQELRETCLDLNQKDDLRVVIITGTGGTFSRGRETFPEAFASIESPAQARWLEDRRVASAVAGLRVPTIAALNGDTVDQGLELALACDLRLAAKGATLGFTDLAHGLIPWDGGTQRLSRIIGRARALELLLTCRLVNADEAFGMGLVNGVFPSKDLLPKALDLAGRIAQAGLLALEYTKEAVHKGQDLHLDQGLGLEADLSFILQSTRDRAEDIRSFIEKRKPRFREE